MARLEYFGTIHDIEDREDLILVTDSQEVNAIADHCGIDDSIARFGGYFVNVDNGDYSEVYGFNGIVPELGKRLWQVFPEEPTS